MENDVQRFLDTGRLFQGTISRYGFRIVPSCGRAAHTVPHSCAPHGPSERAAWKPMLYNASLYPLM